MFGWVPAEREDVGAGVVSILSTLGWVGSSIRVTSSNLAWMRFASGWAEMVRITAAPMPWLARGTMERTFLMKWTRQRCQEAR